MIDATISRVRMRDLARRGRFRPAQVRFTALHRACVSRRETGPEALGSRPLSRRAPERPAHAPEMAISWHQSSTRPVVCGTADGREEPGDARLVAPFAHDLPRARTHALPFPRVVG